MIMNLTSYAKYKDSGVEWLGEVPAHWEMRRTKIVVEARTEKGFPDEPLLAATQTKGVVLKENYELRTVLALKDLHLLKLVRIGDFVISLRSFQGGIEYAREQGIISPAYTILYVRNSRNHGYLAYLFKSKPYIENIGFFVTGIRQGQNIDYEKLSRSRLPLPPLAEQATIVRYLDYVERRIQRYVGTKRKLLGLLAEQKQAIIHHAVTRGLDPDVSLKPSGIEWLGDVPAHWDITRISESINACVNGVWGSEPDGINDLPCVRVADFDRDRLRVNISEPTIRAIMPSERQRRILKTGDLLLEKSGGGDLSPVGAVMLFDHTVSAVCSNFISRVSIKDGFDSTFLVYFHYALYSIRLNTRSIKQTTGIQNLDSSAYLSERVAFPSLPEQTAIAEYLDKTTAKIDAVIARTHREIELISEYRTRLIADVVTGKVDVREPVAKLPDEADADDVMLDSDTDDTLDSDPTFDESVELDMVAEPDNEY